MKAKIKEIKETIQLRALEYLAKLVPLEIIESSHRSFCYYWQSSYLNIVIVLPATFALLHCPVKGR
jgi:hypothetical protein